MFYASVMITAARGATSPQGPDYRIAERLMTDPVMLHAKAEAGRMRIDDAARAMSGLHGLAETFRRSRIFEGIAIAGSVHISPQTAAFVELLVNLGASPRWCSCNPLSTNDDVAAALALKGVPIFGWRGQTQSDFSWCIDRVLDGLPPSGPVLVVDDGADLTLRMHGSDLAQIADRVIGGSEQTTCGVLAIAKLERDGGLKFPVIASNDSETKSAFDNLYGCRESFLDGLRQATDFMVSGSTCTVFGFGKVGEGVAGALRPLGATVCIVEVDPIRALRARFEGYQVLSPIEAISRSNLLVTATGCCQVIGASELQHARPHTVLCNMGHSDLEIDVEWLDRACRKRSSSQWVDRYTLPNGITVDLVARGRIVNVVCASGHPSSVMSLTFSNHLAALADLLVNRSHYERARLYRIPRALDESIAAHHLPVFGGTLARLSQTQSNYLGIPIDGPYRRPPDSDS